MRLYQGDRPPGLSHAGTTGSGYLPRTPEKSRVNKQVGVLRPVNQCGYIRVITKQGSSLVVVVFHESSTEFYMKAKQFQKEKEKKKEHKVNQNLAPHSHKQS